MSYICSCILPGYGPKSALAWNFVTTILLAINSKKNDINFALRVYVSAYVVYKCSVFTICTPAQSTHLLTSQDTCTISLFITDHINHPPSCVHSPVFPLLSPLHHFLAHFLLLPSLYSIWPFVNVWIHTDGFLTWTSKDGTQRTEWKIMVFAVLLLAQTRDQLTWTERIVKWLDGN